MDELSKAEAVLKEFILQMNKWELKYYPLFRSEGMSVHKDTAKKILMTYMAFFAQKKKENKAGKYHCRVVNHQSIHQTKKY
ncbi:Immunity protein RhsIA [Pectobacterium brasiliense]|nr:NTF2 fold immunity protein [Pectobacterium brasiliense]PPE58199.1 Immunity protein RhsIA [Pectobacterium brasiliense]